MHKMLSIPDNQLCQAFDPMMILPEKRLKLLSSDKKMTVSCKAPAYVYLEGSHGKRFLCDFHYFYEKNIIFENNPKEWEEICSYIIDERENISKTFMDYTKKIDEEKKCKCGKKAVVQVIDKNSYFNIYYCNFHFRKTYYRYISNNIDFNYLFTIIDERKLKIISVIDDFNDIKVV